MSSWKDDAGHLLLEMLGCLLSVVAAAALMTVVVALVLTVVRGDW